MQFPVLSKLMVTALKYVLESQEAEDIVHTIICGFNYTVNQLFFP